MNSHQPDSLEYYLEDTKPEKQTQYGLPVLISAGVHLAIFIAVCPQLNSALLKFQEDKSNLVFKLRLDQEEVAPVTSDSQENQITTISESDRLETTEVSNQPANPVPLRPDRPEVKTEERTQVFGTQTALDSAPASTLESNRDTALEDPNYSGNIFDPRVREEIFESQARANRLASVAKPEPYSYIDNSGSEVIVNGDTCYKGTELDELSGTVWSLPYRCPWVKSPSERMMDNINAAMQYRFGHR